MSVKLMPSVGAHARPLSGFCSRNVISCSWLQELWFIVPPNSPTWPLDWVETPCGCTGGTFWSVPAGGVNGLVALVTGSRNTSFLGAFAFLLLPPPHAAASSSTATSSTPRARHCGRRSGPLPISPCLDVGVDHGRQRRRREVRRSIAPDKDRSARRSTPVALRAPARGESYATRDDRTGAHGQRSRASSPTRRPRLRRVRPQRAQGKRAR